MTDSQVNEIPQDRRISLMRGFFFVLFFVFFWPEVSFLGRAAWAFILNLSPAAAPPPLPPGNEIFKAGLILGLNLLAYQAFFLITLFFISFSILPPKNPGEVFQMLRNSYGRLRGHAVFVRDGSGVEEKEKEISQEVGVALVDYKSALVIEGKAKSFAGIGLGPGINKEPAVQVVSGDVVFIRPGQRIRGVVDLRPQVRIKSDLLVRTQDSINLTTNAVATFTLGQPPDILLVAYTEADPEKLAVIRLEEVYPVNEPTSVLCFKLIRVDDLDRQVDPADHDEILQFVRRLHQADIKRIPAGLAEPAGELYTCDPDRVRRAWYTQSRLEKDGKVVHWTELPAQVVGDLLRDLTEKYTYDELFPPGGGESKLGELRGELGRLGRSQGVLAYQFIEHIGGSLLSSEMNYYRIDNLEISSVQVLENPKPSEMMISSQVELENRKPLRRQGIKVLSASFAGFKPDLSLAKDRLSYWLDQMRQERDELQAEYERHLHDERLSDERYFRRQTLGELAQVLLEADEDMDLQVVEVLHRLDLMTSDPDVRRHLGEEAMHSLKGLRGHLQGP